MSDLKIEISADVGNAKTGIDSVTASLGKTAIAAQKLDSSLAKSSTGINQAGQALTNIGRVAQDLPFGFIGIQNNLNPLLESFQRLKVETGSGSAALKALAGSLVGAGGFGLALSLVSSAIVIFQNGIAGFNSKTKEAADKSKDFANSLEDVRAKGAATGVELQNFVNIAKDNTQSLTTRNEALLQANKILGDHGEKLTLVNIATKAVTEEINKYTEATIQQGLASKFVDRATDLIIQQREAAKSYGVELKKLNDISAKPGPLSTTSSTGEDRITSKGAAVAKQTDEVIKLANAYKSVTNELGDVKASLSEAQIEAAKLFGELGHKEKTDKARAGVETISDVLAKLGRQIHELNVEEITFGVDKSKDKISAIESTIRTLVTKFKVAPEDTIIQKLFGDIKNLQPSLDHVFGKTIHLKTSAEILFDLEQAQKEMDSKIGNKKLKTKVQIEAEIQGSNKAPLAAFVPTSTQLGTQLKNLQITYEQFKNSIQQANQDMADSIHNTLDSAFVSLGESIADSLGSGADFGRTVFGNLFKILGAGIKQLGESMIALGTAKIVIEKFKFSPGIGTLLAGIATVAIGSLLQNAIPGFAAGVTNFGGGLAVVGERGPELVRLPRGSDVIPNHLIGGVGEASTNVFIPDIRVRGNDLLVVFNRASQTSGRNG